MAKAALVPEVLPHVARGPARGGVASASGLRAPVAFSGGPRIAARVAFALALVTAAVCPRTARADEAPETPSGAIAPLAPPLDQAPEPDGQARTASYHSADVPPRAGSPVAPGSRSGVVVGLGVGVGVAGASGYPKSASKLGDPNYYSSSNLLAGSGSAFFLMGALTDYLNFGFWFGGGTFESAHWRSTGAGGGVRVEVFPLMTVAPRLANLALFGQAGLGTSKLHEKSGSYPDAEGSQSFLTAGAFYEFRLFRMLGGHVTAGPSLEYDAIFAPTIERHWATVGGRIAFYGGS